MTWKHIGTKSAFKHVVLDYEQAKNLKIEGFKLGDPDILITHQALSMLRVQCGYDQRMVLKEIKLIMRNPNNPSSLKHSRNFLKRLYRTKTPFRNYHYLIEYITGSGVIIEEILFDERLSVPSSPFSRERTMMYNVTQDGNSVYDGPKNKEQILELQNEWQLPKATPYAQTQHITVNGMLNNLTKAGWLMGVHTQVAYPDDQVKKYTLFHNPSDGSVLDLVECIFDSTMGRKSHNSKHLASVIKQQANKPTKWTVHSQGAIIFLAALGQYKRISTGQLNNHQLVIHGSGANVAKMKKVAQSLGMQVAGVRNNPFDAVANSAGEPFSVSGLKRSLQFCGLVLGKSEGASPHTLPYLGIETYRTQLQLLGKLKKEKQVASYIRKHCI